jgi:hypothetical protein
VSGQFEDDDEHGTADEHSGAAESQDDGRVAAYDGGQDPVPTGNHAVDEVLRTMQGLQDRPLEEHVALFEAAHEKLRAALAEAADRPSGPPAR